MYADSSVLTVYNSTFLNNAVVDSYFGSGGAIYITNVNT